MNNFTYLLGAGASIEKVPVVAQFADALSKLLEQIKGHEPGEEYINPDLPSVKESKKRIEDDLQWLIENCNNHASVDTFAKKLYSRGDILEYLKLKSLLNEFFILQQKIQGVDRRYDLFFADIIQGDWNQEPSDRLPSNINILSWNYDNQIEYSIADFFSVNGPQNMDSILQTNLESNFDTDRFGLVKINGSAGGYYSKEEVRVTDKINYRVKGNLTSNHLSQLLLESIIRYGSFQNRLEKFIEQSPQDQLPLAFTSSLHFSWENNQWTKEASDRAREVCSITDYLIIIGYSFPSFNKTVDRKLLDDMHSLQKVIIQSPHPRPIRDKILSYRGDINRANILEVNTVDEFHVPINLLDD
ncbi:MAG: hypothetical protein RIM99_06475 [Cyclobacteriaceae bacterium]